MKILLLIAAITAASCTENTVSSHRAIDDSIRTKRLAAVTDSIFECQNTLTMMFSYMSSDMPPSAQQFQGYERLIMHLLIKQQILSKERDSLYNSIKKQ